MFLFLLFKGQVNRLLVITVQWSLTCISFSVMAGYSCNGWGPRKGGGGSFWTVLLPDPCSTEHLPQSNARIHVKCDL